MKDYGLLPDPPSWALDAGLPAPHEDETFIPYVKRLGLQPRPLLVELTRQTIMLANSRLATTLSRTMRPAFDRHVARLVEIHVTPARRRELEYVARASFGDRFRRSVRSFK